MTSGIRISCGQRIAQRWQLTHIHGRVGAQDLVAHAGAHHREQLPGVWSMSAADGHDPPQVPHWMHSWRRVAVAAAAVTSRRKLGGRRWRLGRRARCVTAAAVTGLPRQLAEPKRVPGRRLVVDRKGHLHEARSTADAQGAEDVDTRGREPFGDVGQAAGPVLDVDHDGVALDERVSQAAQDLAHLLVVAGDDEGAGKGTRSHARDVLGCRCRASPGPGSGGPAPRDGSRAG